MGFEAGMVQKGCRSCVTSRIRAPDIMKIRPDMPVIMCTGYSERISEQEARDMGIRVFALKPIEIQQLSHLIRKPLD
jgi:two-component system cell cycle sensor histidine kinase/response regulator CckA